MNASCCMAISKPARTFQDLLVWQKAHGFVLEVYAFTATLPKQETYGLSLQMRRAAAILASDFLDSHIPKGYQGRSPWLGKARKGVSVHLFVGHFTSRTRSRLPLSPGATTAAPSRLSGSSREADV